MLNEVRGRPLFIICYLLCKIPMGREEGIYYSYIDNNLWKYSKKNTLKSTEVILRKSV